MPKKGVYVGAVKVLGKWHRAMMNVGNNPTYNYQEAGSIEAHLLDFDQDIYEEPVIFRFLSYIREERKFPDARALGEQLKKTWQRHVPILKRERSLPYAIKGI